MSEPDRFEAKARELMDSECPHNHSDIDEIPCVICLAAALRAAEADALERAAQIVGEYGSPIANVEHVMSRIRALASPAAAPAAEDAAKCNGCVIGFPFSDDGRYHVYPTSGRIHSPCARNLAPPSEPVTPEKEIANLLGRGHVRNPREGEPGDAETYSSPAPLLPRVLAALESGFDNSIPGLAAELRAYIAKTKGEGT